MATFGRIERGRRVSETGPSPSDQAKPGAPSLRHFLGDRKWQKNYDQEYRHESHVLLIKRRIIFRFFFNPYFLSLSVVSFAPFCAARKVPKEAALDRCRSEGRRASSETRPVAARLPS